MEDSSTKKVAGASERSTKKDEMIGAQNKPSSSSSSRSKNKKKSSASARTATESSFCFHPQTTLQDIADQLGCNVNHVIAYIFAGESVVCFVVIGPRNSLSRRICLFHLTGDDERKALHALSNVSEAAKEHASAAKEQASAAKLQASANLQTAQNQGNQQDELMALVRQRDESTGAQKQASANLQTAQNQGKHDGPMPLGESSVSCLCVLRVCVQSCVCCGFRTTATVLRSTDSLYLVDLFLRQAPGRRSTGLVVRFRTELYRGFCKTATVVHRSILTFSLSPSC